MLIFKPLVFMRVKTINLKIYTMKKLTILLMLFVAYFAQAQEQRGKLNTEEAIEKRIERMSENLALSDKQKSELKVLFAAQAENRKKQMAENQAFREKIKAVLTPEQQDKLKEQNVERRQKMKERIKEKRAKKQQE